MPPEEIAANFTWTVADGFYSLLAIVFLVGIPVALVGLTLFLKHIVVPMIMRLPTRIIASVRNRRKAPTNVSLASNKEPLV